MAAASTNKVLEAYLRGPGAAAWTDALRNARDQVAAEEIQRNLDMASGTLADGALALDRTDGRQAFLSASSELPRQVAEALLAHKADINTFLKSNGCFRQSGGRLKSAIEQLVPTLLASAASQSVAGESPFPNAWPRVANVIARELHARWSSGGLSEWLVHNHALLSAFFLTCRLPEVRLVRTELDNRVRNANGIRGALLRIVERVGPEGIRDIVPPAAVRSGPVRLHHANLSVLLSSVERLANAVPQHGGAFQSTLNTGMRPNIPANAPAVVTEELTLKARRLMFQQYDYTVLGHMTIAAVEQLLRTWAEHLHVHHHDAGVPLNLKRWVHLLGCSSGLLARLDDLYDAKHANVRNRSNHGALLEAENLRMDAALQLVQNPSGVVTTNWNRYSPENIAGLCLECLEQIDREAPTVLGPAATAWIADFAPTPSDLVSVADPNTDLFDPRCAELWRRRLRSYVLGVSPAASLFFQAGYQGWVEHAFGPSFNLAKQYALLLVFEAVARNTLHTMNANILQIGPEGDGMKVYYRMLEYRDKGLCCDENVSRLLESSPESQHAAIRHNLRTAIHIRDAFAHGAVQQFDEHSRDAMGHCLIKTIQLFTHAGRAHMIRENAYFRWLQRHSQEDRSLEDWLLAQNMIAAFFQSLEASQ